MGICCKMRHITDKTCKSCGVTFPGGPRAWYCPTCRMERAKAANREHKKRKRLGVSRKVGDLQICVDCRKQYAYYIGASERCRECAKKYGKIIDLQKSKDWNANNKSEYLKAKRDFENRKRQETAPVKTGEKYIYFDRGKNRYRVIINGIHIGYYPDPESAIIARDGKLKNN